MVSQPGIPDSDELKDALRSVFDSQIPNFGSYNLVYGSGPRGRLNVRPGASGCYVVGYRWQPLEIVIAPVAVPSLTADGAPTAINRTNLSHAVVLANGDYDVGTSTGRSFRFGVPPAAQIPGPAGPPLVLNQEEDCEDFRAFMAEFIGMA